MTDDTPAASQALLVPLSAKLVIPGRPVSANVLLRMHWSRRRQLAALWYYPTLVAYQAAGSPRFERPVVTVTSVFGSAGRRDADNMLGTWKIVADHLTALGAWADDSAIVSLTSRVEVRRGVWQLEIEIEEAG